MYIMVIVNIDESFHALMQMALILDNGIHVICYMEEAYYQFFNNIVHCFMSVSCTCSFFSIFHCQ